MAEGIGVRVNGKDRRAAAGTTVRELLAELGLLPALVVVEHNRVILDRGRYEEVVLGDGDEIELVHFVGGG